MGSVLSRITVGATGVAVADLSSCSLCRFKEMREANQAMAEVALNLYRECLRKVLMQRGGYECQETEGSFMLSFYNCVDAVQFCILVSHMTSLAFPAAFQKPHCCIGVCVYQTVFSHNSESQPR